MNTTDKIEMMTFDYFCDNFTINPKNCVKINVAKILATDPDAFRLVVIDNMPSHQRFVLKHAILNSWKQRNIPWASITISDFTDEVILSIKSGRPFNPRKFDDDNLIIDDLQWILGKMACQEEFVRTILKRRLERERKCLTVLFCEYPLSELVALTDELQNLLKIGIKEELE